MELDEYFRFFLALIFVLGLIGALALVARRAGFGHRNPFKGLKDKRLSIVEIMQVDGRRRLVLLRRDDTEHLVLLGTTSETVIETGITPPVPEKNIDNPAEPESET